MNTWKFNLGDIVTTRVQGDYDHCNKMLVVSRNTEESEQATIRYYIVSHYKMGEMVHTRVFEAEIIQVPVKA